MPSHPRLLGTLASFLLLLAAGPAGAAPPEVPLAIPYQGVLLDAGGAPQSGVAELTLRLYDAPVGGTLLYKQLASAPLADGVFSVTLGPTGTPADTPTNPLTTSLAEALAGDLAATGAARFLEVTVGSEGPLARTQLLAVPYALTAASAQRADVATSAEGVSQVGSMPAAALSGLWEHVDFDENSLPNDHLFEGVVDTDGDGVPNFLDKDNDGDGRTDFDEVALGRHPNRITPRITSVSPSWVPALITSTVTVNGEHFGPGMSVTLGTEAPTPTSVTPTSFQIEVGPQPTGGALLRVTLANAEWDTSFLNNFFRTSSGLTHGFSLVLNQRLSVDVTELGVALVGGNAGYSGSFADGTSFTTYPFPSNGALAVVFDPGDAVAGLRCRAPGPFNCRVELARDADGSRVLEPAEAVEIESLSHSTGVPGIHGPSLAFDPAGRAVAGYVAFTSSPSRAVRIARDLDGDGAFTSAGELRTIASVSGSRADSGDLAVDDAGRTAYAYYDTVSGVLRVAYDRNGDGDFDDTVAGTPEIQTVTTAPAASLSCFGITFDQGQDLTLVWNEGAGPQLGRDADGDGGFGFPGEVAPLASTPTGGCDVDGRAGVGLAVVHSGSGVHLLVDRDQDGAFTGPDEDVTLTATSGQPVRVRRGSLTAVATGTHFYLDEVP